MIEWLNTTMECIAMRRDYINVRAKEQTNSFYLSDELLKCLDLIADIEGQSRSVVIERALFFVRINTRGGYRDERKAWKNSQKKYNNKKKKKVHSKQKCHKADSKGGKSKRNKQKCLFD